MSESKVAASGGGMGCFTVLTIIFITLKVANLIAWPWWQVFIPMYLLAGVIIILLAITAVAFSLAYILDSKANKKGNRHD